MPTRCKHIERLLLLYSEATEYLSVCVGELSSIAASYEADAFERWLVRADQAKVRCEELRQQVLDHLRQHECVAGLEQSISGSKSASA
jgi:hypothetical protein